MLAQVTNVEHEEAREVMREGLAIQMYNELQQYSVHLQTLEKKKKSIKESLHLLKEELKCVEKQEQSIEYEIESRKKMLKKLSRQQYRAGK